MSSLPVPPAPFLGNEASNSAATRAALLDDPHEWGAFGRPAEQTAASRGGAQVEQPDPASVPLWESFIVLQGMHCAACALSIEEALRAVPGVERAEVSAATQRARIVWRPALVRPSQWLAAVRRAGYSALPAQDALAREQRLAEGRRALWRWLVAGFCMMQVMMYAWPAYVAQPGDLSLEMEALLRWASWVISLPVLLFCCGPFFASALRDLRVRRVSMDLPVALGMGITFVISSLGTFDMHGPFGGEVFFDSLTMFVFFLLTGRWLELRLREQTVGAVEAVLNRLPDAVLRMAADGSTFEAVTARRLRVGDVLRVRAGDAFAADGIIVRGQCHADEALLTGESAPVPRRTGEAVTAGSYNLDATVEVRITALGGDTRFAQIVALMESAALQKPRLAQLADRIARPFLIIVLLAALAAAAWWWSAGAGQALMLAVAVLIVTCPCALSLATPVAMLTAAGALARHGVLVRRLQALEALAAVDTVVFDKTGTLTGADLAVRAVHVAAGSALRPQQALNLAAEMARHSLHPAARALAAAADDSGAGGWRVEQVQEIPGAGLLAQGGAACPWRLRLGSAAHALLAPQDAQAANQGQEKTHATRQLVLSVEGHADFSDGVHELARFALDGETLRPEAQNVVRQLQQAGIEVELLSGDHPAAVQQVAARLGIARAQGACTPQDKLQHLHQLQAQGRRVAMCGDGLNDGPVLAGAHASFALGTAVPLAQSRADFVIKGENLALLAYTLRLARRTMRVVRQNLGWAAGYNALCIPLAWCGLMPAWLAGLGMAASSLLVLLNSARLAREPFVLQENSQKIACSAIE